MTCIAVLLQAGVHRGAHNGTLHISLPIPSFPFMCFRSTQNLGAGGDHCHSMAFHKATLWLVHLLGVGCGDKDEDAFVFLQKLRTTAAIIIVPCLGSFVL